MEQKAITPTPTPMELLAKILKESIQKTKEQYEGDKDYVEIVGRSVDTMIDGCNIMHKGYEKLVLKDFFREGMKFGIDLSDIMKSANDSELDEYAEKFYNKYFNK
jgi:hypothetical protein